MLKLSRVAPHEWEFVFPDAYNDLMDKFHSGCESYEEGNLDEAEKVFKMVLAQIWEEDPEALEWLRGITRQTAKTLGGKGQ